MSQSNLLICYDYIKNNSYINLDAGSHIRIVWSCSNAVNTLNVNIFHKFLQTGRPVAKTLIEYNSNNLEKNEVEEEKSFDIEFIEQKADPDNYKIAIDS